MEDKFQTGKQLKQIRKQLDQLEQIEQIHNYQKASKYIDGFCHGYIICSVLCILIGICIYFVV